MNANPAEHDFSWTVKNEISVYRTRELSGRTFPNAPTTATQKRGWDVTVTSKLAGLDCTANDTLVRWIQPALNPIGTPREVFGRLHNNSQGLIRLDKWVAEQMLTNANLESHEFGTQFATYVEWCQANSTSARGRVLVAMVCLLYTSPSPRD